MSLSATYMGIAVDSAISASKTNFPTSVPWTFSTVLSPLQGFTRLATSSRGVRCAHPRLWSARASPFASLRRCTIALSAFDKSETWKCA
ncbi:MAG: hypothetical protein J6X81_05170 [Muribaculaceae bacterium]|nr:hypothetical protein [Muribaculaceae bacterium]